MKEFERQQTPGLDQRRAPSVEYILSGQAKFTYVGETGGFLQDREIGERTWPGSSHQYTVDLPRAGRNDTWTTYFTVWSRLPLNYGDWVKPPGNQLFMTTGQGEMRFSDDPDVVNDVINEIYRQMEVQNDPS
jgi:hypothetical protein